MAQAVVDVLEQVQVHEDSTANGWAARDGVFQLLGEAGAVGQAGERVGVGLPADQFLGAFLRGDVAGDGGRADDLARRVSDQGRADRDLRPRAVFVPPGRVRDLDVPARPQPLPDALPLLLHSGGSRPFDAAPDHLLGGPAVQPLRAGVPTGDDFLRGPADDGVLGRVDDGGQAVQTPLRPRGAR